VVLAEALKARLKMLENANPDGVRRKIARLDSTLANDYPHLRGPAARPAAWQPLGALKIDKVKEL